MSVMGDMAAFQQNRDRSNERDRVLNVDTLGDIHKILAGMVERGAHPGAIHWVLRHQIIWPEGPADRCEDLLEGQRFRMQTAIRSLEHILVNLDQENRDEIFRITGKIEGMKVALSYIEESLRCSTS
jgi:hypothetical protein